MVRLANLTPEELYVLLGKLRHVQAAGDASAYLLPDDALHAFMEHCHTRIGAAYFQTPRTSIRAFVQLLAILEQNPGADWRALLGSVDVARESNPELEPVPADEDAAPAAAPSITRGRYRLELSDAAAEFRAVDTATGAGCALDELSRGTRVQLLCRLATVPCRGGTPHAPRRRGSGVQQSSLL